MLSLHRQARFCPLTEHRYLLYIPSTLTGVVVDTHTYTLLQLLYQPSPWHWLAEVLPALFLRRCVALGILHDRAPVAPPAASDTLVAWLHVTNACNLRCTYCYLTKTNESMNEVTGRAAIDAVVRSALLHGYRGIKLKFAGGEASLNLPLVWHLLDYARNQVTHHGLELDAVMLSNGIKLGKADLQQMRDKGVRLMISLDGLATDHDLQRISINGKGSFSAVVKTIRRALDSGLAPDISVTVSGQTAGGLAELVSWLLQENLSFNLNFYRENDCAVSMDTLRLDEEKIIAGMLAAFTMIEANLPERSLLGGLIDRSNLATPHTKTCGVGENYLVIDQRGGIAKCQMEIERPITSIYAPDPLTMIRLDPTGVQNLPVQEKEGCRECDWQLWCAGGCAVATFRATGRYDIQSPNCGIYKALYPAALRLEGLRILAHGTSEYFCL